MVDHAERAHSTWSASATARRTHCLGSLVMEAQVEEDDESIHSARGTAAHTVAERCLREGKDGLDFLDLVVKTKKFEIVIDEELAASAQAFADYVRGRLAKYKAETGRDDAVLSVEQRFSLNELGTPFDAGGTGDAVIYFPAWRLIEIVDLKNGRGYVSEKENMQLRSYAAGALLANPGCDIDNVMSTIVQPRLPGRSPVRDETISVGELISWTADLLASMNLAKQAEDEFWPAQDNSVLFDEWAKKWLKPGNCTFCKREGSCPANRASAVGKIDPKLASKWFEAEVPANRNTLPPEDPAQIAADLDAFDEIESWIKARRAYAHKQAENGVKLPTADGEEYYLADKIGNRAWKADEAVTVASLLSPEIGLPEDKIYARKLKSPAQIDAALGAKRKGLAEDLWEKPITGTNLVRSDKTTRPATKSKVETYFESNKDN